MIRDICADANEVGVIGVFYWEGTWIPVCKDGRIYLDGKGSVQGKTTVSASSALILKQD